MTGDLMYPPSFLELDLERGCGMVSEDIVSYAYPPGRRERYTENGWGKYQLLVSDLSVHPALDFHDRGCVNRYGAQSNTPCECEKRIADSANGSEK